MTTKKPPVGKDGSVVLPAGDYWLGDPVYSFTPGSKEWMKWLDQAGDGPTFLAAATGGFAVAFSVGEGGYDDGHGHELSVESGLLGLVPAKSSRRLDRIKVRFDEPFTCRQDESSVSFGALTISTEVQV